MHHVQALPLRQTVVKALGGDFDASSSTDNVGITAYNWEFPDGSSASGVTATKTLSGNGRHTVRLTVTDTDGNSASTTRDVVVSSQDPFGGTPHAVAGRIEFEDFDEGGEGVAYHDNDTQNRGNKTRSNDGVDLETCQDTDGGFNIGFTENGEWMEYTVDVATAGDYNLDTLGEQAVTGVTSTFSKLRQCWFGCYARYRRLADMGDRRGRYGHVTGWPPSAADDSGFEGQ